MALDELADTDTAFDIDGFKFIVNTEFMEKAQPIKVDFMGMGFKLDCGLDFGPAGGCAGCGSASDSCG